MKRKIIDIEGKRFGMLTILKEVKSTLNRNRRCVEAKCDCGNIKQYALEKLLYGHTKSCGCSKGRRGDNLRTHGLRRHPLYGVWNNIRTRCYCEKYAQFHNYGGRGVVMCDEWRNDFMAFYEWAINNGWQKGLDIDKDIKGDGLLYSPDTCCFVTEKVNNNHTRDNKYLTYRGEILSMSELADKYNVNYFLLRKRMYMGWSVEDAVNKPSRKNKPQVAA